MQQTNDIEGDDLIQALGFAYPNCEYVIYGTKLDPHEITLPGRDETEQAKGLVWLDESTPRPTQEDLRRHFARLQQERAAAADNEKFFENWPSFAKDFQATPEFNLAWDTCTDSNSWQLLVTYLSSKPPSPEMFVKVLNKVRKGMPKDYSPTQIAAIESAAGIKLNVVAPEG